MSDERLVPGNWYGANEEWFLKSKSNPCAIMATHHQDLIPDFATLSIFYTI